MPSLHAIKKYVGNGYYYIYNRGINGRNIFEGETDYQTFTTYLREYLSPISDPKEYIKTLTFKGKTFQGIPRLPNNYTDQIELFAYSLTPNSFQLLIKQKTEEAMRKFIQSLITRYSIYFNKKYHRHGTLFQGRYKAVQIEEEAHLLPISKHIHLTPLNIVKDITRAYSSYLEYLGKRYTKWLNPYLILSFFETNKQDFTNTISTYRHFVEENDENIQKEFDETLGKYSINNML